MRLLLKSEEDTRAFAQALGACLRAGDTVLLKGDLGAGKSVLVRAAAWALGIHEPMPSPTFTLMQPYQGRETVCHFDLYRLSDADEFYAAGLDEPLGRDVCFIEWPMEDVDVPEPKMMIELTVPEDRGARRAQVSLCGFGAREVVLREAMSAWEEKDS